MTIQKVCIRCKSTFKLSTQECPRCNRTLTHFKARRKATPQHGKWSTRQSESLAEVQAWASSTTSGVSTTSTASTTSANGQALGDVWLKFLPWAQTNLRSWSSYETDYRLRLSPIEHLPLQAITPEKVYSILDGMQDKAAGTRYHTRALLSRLFNFARRRLGYRGENPIQFVERERFDNVRRRILGPEENERLLAVLQDWPNRPAARLILFLYWTGRRRGECRQLTFENVDLQRGVATFPAATTKSKRTNVVPVCIEAWDILREAQVDSSGKPYVFPSMTGKFAWDVSRTFKLVCVGSHIKAARKGRIFSQ